MITIINTMKDSNEKEFACDRESVIKKYLELKELTKDISSFKSLVDFCRNNINKYFSKIYINDIDIERFNDDDIEVCRGNEDYVFTEFRIDNFVARMECRNFELLKEIDIRDTEDRLLYDFVPYHEFYNENYKSYCLY